jgi:hypothetical protein
MMTATILDLAMIRAERAAAAAEAAAAAWKSDPMNNPLVVLIARSILEQLVADQERAKMRSMMRSISIISDRRHNR